jgi:hypothetical protein
LLKIAEIWQKSPKFGKNLLNLANFAVIWQKTQTFGKKIAENWQKIAENLQNIAENCDHSIDPGANRGLSDHPMK